MKWRLQHSDPSARSFELLALFESCYCNIVPLCVATSFGQRQVELLVGAAFDQMVFDERLRFIQEPLYDFICTIDIVLVTMLVRNRGWS